MDDPAVALLEDVLAGQGLGPGAGQDQVHGEGRLRGRTGLLRVDEMVGPPRRQGDRPCTSHQAAGSSTPTGRGASGASVIALDRLLAGRHNAAVRLTGWNDIPARFGAQFKVQPAPAWLRVLYRTPFLDRFADAALVRRGLGVLSPHSGWTEEDRAAATGGGQVDDGADPVLGSVSLLAPRRRR